VKAGHAMLVYRSGGRDEFGAVEGRVFPANNVKLDTSKNTAFTYGVRAVIGGKHKTKRGGGRAVTFSHPFHRS